MVCDSRELSKTKPGMQSVISLWKKLDPGAPKHATLDVDGRMVPVTFRRHTSARRIIMRVNRKGDGVTVTLPPGASAKSGLEFAASQAGWIASQLDKRPEKVSFEDGATVPLRGEPHVVRHSPGQRGTISIDPGPPAALLISGGQPHVPRRLKDWLKRQAREDLSRCSQAYATAMGVKYGRISIRDTASRWGSCSSSGTLSYSWRLILAPPFVLDYVAAHEVAHLIEMNHGPAFWTLVREHCARTEEARKWLKTEGASLHVYDA